MSWKPEVFVDNQWIQNAMVFGSEDEARMAACDIFSKWLVCSAYRTAQSDAKVNYAIVEGKLVPVE